MTHIETVSGYPMDLSGDLVLKDFRLPMARAGSESSQIIEIERRRRLRELQEVRSAAARLAALQKLPDDWDGNGSLKPKKKALERAATLLASFFSYALAANDPFRCPHISASESGDVVFELWHDRNKISIYCSSTKFEWLKVPSADIDEMTIQKSPKFKFSDYVGLFEWLFPNA